MVTLSFRAAPSARPARPGTRQGFAPTRHAVLEAYARLPLSFEANQGQTDPQVKFLARGRGYTLFLTSAGAVVSLKSAHMAQGGANGVLKAREAVLRMKLAGAAAAPRVAGVEPLPGKSNYLRGNDPKRWHKNVAHYAGVKYEGVYPGVDLVFHGRQHQLEYDFELAPGADPRTIRLVFEGAEALRQDERGDLVLRTPAGEFRQHAPLIYQQIRGERRLLSGGYTLEATGQVGFQVAAYDPSKPLIIDPVLAFSSFLGGNNADEGAGIALDSAGNAYVTGSTSSVNFPTSLGAYQSTCGGCPDESDAFVTKLDPRGSTLVFSTYLGGSDSDEGIAVAVDSSGVYVTGDTFSPDFPTTPGAFQTNPGGGTCGSPPFPCPDAFLTKLDPSGSALVYSTYLGGSNSEFGHGIAVDSSGSAYVVGSTASNDFPTTPGAFQTTFGGGTCGRSAAPCPDAFVTKFDSTGSMLVYSTYLGGSKADEALGIALDSSNNAYVTGFTASADFPTTLGAFQTVLGGGTCSDSPCPDAFVTKLDPTGSTLVYSTYLGGDNQDAGAGIALDSSGNAYVTGDTNSSNFPKTPGAFQTSLGGGICGIPPDTAPCADAFITKLNSTGSGVVYSTFLGGNNEDEGNAIAVDAAGNTYVTGSTSSTNFPTLNAVQGTFGGGLADAFVTKLNAAGSGLVYSTYFGGLNNDEGAGIAVDASGNAYVTGNTNSANFRTTPEAFQTTFGGGMCDTTPCSDAFVINVSP